MIIPESEMFRHVRERAGTGFWEGWPDCDTLTEMAKGLTNSRGRQILFVDDEGRDYESRIYLKGEIQTRKNSCHDLFNALVWMTFPKAKACLNSIHFHEMAKEAGHRGKARDIATHFDESGVIVATSDEALSAKLQNFEWHSLFWENRRKVLEEMRFFMFGHGLLEKALSPFMGLTGNGLVFPVEKQFFSRSLNAQLAILDESFEIRYSKIEKTRDFSPVPLLGYPGWMTENSEEAFYLNESYFRKGRRSGMGRF